MADTIQKECSVNEKYGVESVVISEEGIMCDKEKEHQHVICPSTRADGQLQELDDGHSEVSQAVLTAFPVTDEDFRSSNPIHVSLIDGQVIHLTSRSVIDNNRKVRKFDNSKCSDEVKSIEKSLMLITSNDKTYILPPGLTSEGDYLLAEEVLCEEVLHSGNLLPEEQILTIPSPSSVEFATGTKPDALAIAASEVFNDSCLNPPLQENRCVSDSGECQILGKEQDNFVQKSDSDIYSKSCCKLHLPGLSHQEPISFSECLGENKLTDSVTEKSESNKVKVDHMYLLDNDKEDQKADCRKSRFFKNLETGFKNINNCDVYNHISKSSKVYIVPTNSLHDESKTAVGTSIAIPTTEEQTASVNDGLNLIETPESVSLEKSEETLEYLQPLLVEDNYVSNDYYYENESNQIPTGTKLRRSSRILKVKKDSSESENNNTCLGEPGSRKKRRDLKGEMKKALWDCVKCDAMFRTKTSRDRHMQEGHLFTCYMCHWQGLTKTKYEIHISTIHCSEKARCLICRKDFPNYGEYKDHLENKHPLGMEQRVKEIYLKNSTPLEEDTIDDHPSYRQENQLNNNGKSTSINGTRLSLKAIEIEELKSDGKHGCPYCGKKFERFSRFVRHLNYHRGNRSFTCKICKKSFVEKSGLEAHLKTHRPINEPCNQCGKIFKTHRTMKRHLRTHQNTLYTCDVCLKDFRHEESLRVHKTVHKEGGSGNVCSLCDKDCKTHYYLQLHMANKHESPKFKCNMCNRSFKWKQSYRKHMVIHSENSCAGMKYKCTVCQRRFITNHSLTHHQYKHNKDKKYSCEICSKWFKHDYTRDKHVKTVHLEEREHMCPQCGALFKAKAYLDQHLAQVHTTKERVKCQTCGHDFKTKSILRSHIKLVHNSTNAKYVCQICKKTFSAPKDLARHNKVHTGVKDHICPVCRRSFSRKDNMTSHLRTHSKDLQETIMVHQENLSVSPDAAQPSTQDPLDIFSLPSDEIPSSNNTIVTSSNLQPITTSSTNIMDSNASLVSGSITISALPVPSISLPSSMSNSLSNTLVYSNTSTSSACIVLSSKPPSSTLPVVVFSGSSINNSHILPNSQATLSTVSLGNIHSSISNFQVNPPLTSPTNISSATTLTYCSGINISLAPSSNSLCPDGKSTVTSVSQRGPQVVALHPYNASNSHEASTATTLPHFSLSSVTPVTSHSECSNVETVSQDPSVFSSSLHSEQIVLTEEVLDPNSTISSHQ